MQNNIDNDVITFLTPSSTRWNVVGGGLLIAVRHGLCASIMIDEGENADFLTVKLEVFGKCIRLILVYGPQEKVPESTRETFWHNIGIQVERAKLSVKQYC